MISKESMNDIKEVLYMNCRSSQFCCNCLGGICDGHHCLHSGTLKIGVLEKLQQLINDVLNDTSPQKFRINEACHFLQSQGYITFNDGIEKMNYFGVTTFYCTPKLWTEMSNGQSETRELL